MKKIITVLWAAMMAMAFSSQVIASDIPHNGKWITFHGFVEKMPVGLYGSWTISGRSILVTPYCTVEQKHGLGTLGSYAEVRGIDNGTTFRAKTVQIKPGGKFLVVEPPDHKHENGRLQGVIDDLPKERIGFWEIGGHSVLVDKLSQIIEVQGRAVMGAMASVVGYYRNNTFYVQQVVVK